MALKKDHLATDLKLDEIHLQHYLQDLTGASVEIKTIKQLGSEISGEEALKQFGFGRPLCICFQIRDSEERVVLHRVRRNAFGREREDDRVAAIWLDYRIFNQLPRHVPAMDMLIQKESGELRSIGSAEEMMLVSGYRSGNPYAEDLIRIRDEGTLAPIDFKRVEALATYLAKIHQMKISDPDLWRRRLRDLIGHGEGVMGLTDSYPQACAYVDRGQLIEIEGAVNQWRWRLKPFCHRLRQVHGDFHPFNVLFESGTNFCVLDRSRGAWGEPADDVSCMTINYLFFSLQRSHTFDGPFRELHDLFWKIYFQHLLVEEMLSVIQPWFAWRALVLASPVWYPDLSDETRRIIIHFACNVLSSDSYDYQQPQSYFEAR